MNQQQQNEWRELAEIAAGFPKEAGCEKWGWALFQDVWLPGQPETFRLGLNNPYYGFIVGTCLRIDDTSKLDSRQFLENCGCEEFYFGFNPQNKKWFAEFDFADGYCIKIYDFHGIEIALFKATIELGKLAWIENRPEFQAIWRRGMGVEK